MEAFLAQVAAAARKASDQGYSTQGRPPVQRKSAAAGRPLKRGAVRQRSSSARALTEARNGNGGPTESSMANASQREVTHGCQLCIMASGPQLTLACHNEEANISHA